MTEPLFGTLDLTTLFRLAADGMIRAAPGWQDALSALSEATKTDGQDPVGLLAATGIRTRTQAAIDIDYARRYCSQVNTQG